MLLHVFFVPSHHTGRMRHSLSRDFSYPCQGKRAYKIFEKCLNQICYFCGWKRRMHEWYFWFGCGCYLVPLHVQSYHVQAYDGFHRHFALVYHTDFYDEFHLHFDLVYPTDHTVATHGRVFNFYHELVLGAVVTVLLRFDAGRDFADHSTRHKFLCSMRMVGSPTDIPSAPCFHLQREHIEGGHYTTARFPAFRIHKNRQ